MKRQRFYQIAGILLLGFFLLAPRILPEMKIHLVIEILIYALWAVAFNLLFGHGGLLAFGFGAPFGIGAYVTAMIFRDLPGCWKVAWGLTPSGYQSYVSQQIQLGYRVWKVQGYANSGRYGVVLHDPTGPCQ